MPTREPLPLNAREIIERLQFPGVLGVVGRRLEKTFAYELNRYFRWLAYRVEQLDFASYAEQDAEHALAAADFRLQRALRVTGPWLQAILLVNIYDGFIAAARQELATHPATDTPLEPRFTEAIDYGRIDFLGVSGEEAAEYARRRSAQLVRDINRTTRQLIADAVRQGISDQLGVPGLSRLIRKTVRDMSKNRADLIATTEMNNAMSEAALRKMQRNNFTYKKIILSPDACPVCVGNHAEDPLPVDALYSSGDARPPFHPRCRCAIAAARPPH